MTKILLVDDDFLVRTFLSRLTDWEKHGYTLVGAAQDGEEALRMTEEYRPDIIITDISMPVMDGIELIRRLRQQENTACIVVLSCHDDFDYVREAMKLGANEYVLKNLLTEDTLLKLLVDLKKKIVSTSQGGLQFDAPEVERAYYLKLLQGSAPRPEDGFHTGAALAVLIFDYEIRVSAMELEQQKRFHSSFAQICREVCRNQSAIRCIHVQQGEYALLLDFSGISSVYERREKIQQYASAVVRYAERYLAVSVCVGTSRAENFNPKADECWQEAQEARNERFYSAQTVLYGWQIEPCGKEIPSAAQRFSEEVPKYMEKRDGGLLRQRWEEALAAFRAEHTEARLVQEWLRQTDRKAGIPQRTAPDMLDGFRGLERAYLTFREEILPQPDNYSSAVSRTIRYLQQNHTGEATLIEAAEQVHLNPAYLSHIFSKETGITFSEYLLSCRLGTAKELLVNTDDKIREVSAKSGFNDYRNFCKVFKKTVGETPQNYRKQCRTK